MAFTYFFRGMQTLEVIRDHVVPALRTRRYNPCLGCGAEKCLPLEEFLNG